MKLTFLGAAHEVTGSCFLLEFGGKKILIDCGMEQGKDIYENQSLPVSANEIDYVFLTHAHIDHSGNLPLLYAQGFRGEIMSTEATAELCNIMLRDSAHIQEFEAEWRNRKNKRSGEEPYLPVYTMADAIGAINLFKTFAYNRHFKLTDDLVFRFVDAGHLLGSASIELKITEYGETKTVVFSGDIGNVNQPLIKDPSYLTEADYVVMESTYGDRSHGAADDYISVLTKVIQKTFDRGGNVVIPSFAVGRTQELLYFIRQIKEEGLIKGHGNFTVYLDSPLAIEATKIFHANMSDYFDAAAMALVKKGINPIDFSGLKLSVTSDDSKSINFDNEPKIIISASGMCEAGRIRHHLKHNLWRPESTILFAGFQAVGTLGRTLLDGAAEVKLFGETIEVRAEVTLLIGVSGHADNEGLMKWAGSFKEKPERVFVVHGEDSVCDIFAQRLENELGYTTAAPYNGETWDLLQNVKTEEGNKVRIVKTPAAAKVSVVYERLMAAGRRLMNLIAISRGRANKDLAKFADQINSVCDKWER